MLNIELARLLHHTELKDMLTKLENDVNKNNVTYF